MTCVQPRMSSPAGADVAPRGRMPSRTGRHQEQRAGAEPSTIGHAAAAARARRRRNGACIALRCAAHAPHAPKHAACGTHANVIITLPKSQLWRTNGVRGLFRGVTPSVLRAFLVSGSRFSAYEGALELLRSGD